ncbi:efflux RND transporter periplasmic adaptor subunit [Pandoraea sp.]|uniref:efflux RND transporter periplasmic adaptor subunit n=1 Tax=Pandoraea sp. TaxID=1883445 RepID=UPI001208D1F3|nr:efflux RND transporter periplasmic adaptor subunit [Pandoraea sp.]TAL56261.1 MAG: efflux RND transporter periplasmic adaptor subunit [Pandoraea sp.]TAM19216.1 MAG: efflux RND transporter periplasmic adaptor subunit [Pandoraea sp.]
MSLSRKRLVLFVAAALAVAVAGGLAAVRVNANVPHAQSATPAPAQVDVAAVISRTITDWQDYSGRLQAVDRVEIRPQVSGTLMAVHFKDGSLVKKGQLLFTIDPRPYQARVDQAEAQLSAARARAAYTASDLARAQRLLADNAIAKRDFDEKQNASREAAANLQAAQAALAVARLNLGYTRIVAPFTGRVSRAAITAGNVVAAGAASAPLTTLVSVSPIYASFDVDEQSYLKFIAHAGVDRGHDVPVYLGLADERGYPRKGEVQSIDNHLDTASGTIRVRAVFDNPDGALIPGLYARIRLAGSRPHPAVLISEQAIGTDQNKKFVLVLDAHNRADYREVTLGAVQDGLRVIASGLQPGERIVVNGLQRVRPGDLVAPHMVPMATDAALAAAEAAQAAQG